MAAPKPLWKVRAMILRPADSLAPTFPQVFPEIPAASKNAAKAVARRVMKKIFPTSSMRFTSVVRNRQAEARRDRVAS